MVDGEKYIEINNFKGVDFSNDDMAVDPARSPNAVNIMADIAGRPELRPGIAICRFYEKGKEKVLSKIICISRHNDLLIAVSDNGIYAAERGTEKREYNIIHSCDCTIDKGACTFKMNGKTYICGSGIYKEFTPETGFKDVEAYIPTTTIGRKPEGGGTVYESINMLTAKRKNTFCGDGSSKEYWLDGKLGYDPKVDTYNHVAVKVNGVKYTPGSSTDARSFDFVNAQREGFDGEYCRITFNTAPPDGDGADNVEVTYISDTNSAEKIKNCTICSTYGVGNDSRIFLAGNDAYPNTDWHSGLYDPTYFPDTGYTQVGDDTPIYGYLKRDGYQMVVKKAYGNGTGLYLRTAELKETLNISGEHTEMQTVFGLYEGVPGVGLTAKNAVMHIMGDAMMLTPDGVLGLETNNVTNRNNIQDRSYYIARKLKDEKLENAATCVWGKYGIIAVDKHLYICDTGKTNANPKGYTGYEWFYWEMPVTITTMLSMEGTLILGSTGGVFELKNTSEGMTVFSDETAEGKSGIKALWSTPLLYGGDFMRYKTISKRGCGVLAKPFARGSGEILMTTDKKINDGMAYTTDILNFEDVDFNRFTFNLRTEPRVKVYPKKHKKVLFFQMAVKHDAPDEGWGISAMRVTYRLGSLIKRST